jgi:hypothetical protein
MQMIRSILEWFTDIIIESTIGSKEKPQSRDPIYLGSHSWTVDRAYGSGKQVIATDAGWDDLDELTEWCKDNGCQCFWDRVIWDQWSHRWSSNGIGGADYIFIQAEGDEKVTLARLVWGI